MPNTPAADQNKPVVLVKTAIPLPEKETAELRKVLEAKLGFDFEIKNLVDKSLIAGIYVRFGDQVFDTTFRTHLDRIRERLNQ